MAFLLGCEKIGVNFPTKTVFGDVSLGVDEGARIGIVGRNGDGKSTLLSLLSGRLEPDSGRVVRTRDVSVGVLGQTDDLSDDATVHQSVVGDLPEYEWAGDAEVRAIICSMLTRTKSISITARAAAAVCGVKAVCEYVPVEIGGYTVMVDPLRVVLI